MIVIRTTRFVLVALAGLAVLAGAASMVNATIPAPGGVINGCYRNATGALRVIDYPTHHCGIGETFLRWNQTGPRGPQGLQGPPGISGYEQKSQQVFVTAGAVATVSARCSAGKKVLGGGFNIETPTDVKVFATEPSDGAGNYVTDRWSAIVQNTGSVTRQVTVNAICALVL